MLVAEGVCIFTSFVFTFISIFLRVAFTTSKESVIKVAVLPSVVVAGALQLYFWGLWAAFCSASSAKFSAAPEVSHHWLYYIAAFIYCTAPCTVISKAYMGFHSAEARDIQRRVALYNLIAATAFIIFCVWPSLYAWPYSWALGFVV
jgi:hypothetical protein